MRMVEPERVGAGAAGELLHNRRACLTARDSRGAVILHCIIKQMSLIGANLALDKAGEETL